MVALDVASCCSCCCLVLVARFGSARRADGTSRTGELFSMISLAALTNVTVDDAETTLQSSAGVSLVKCSLDCLHRSDCIGFYFRREAGACRLLRWLALSPNEDDLFYMNQAGFGTHGIVSLNKTALQSTSYPDVPSWCCVPAYAFDGSIATIAHTEGIPYQWIAVDLGGQHLVSTIAVTARCDCCGYRVHDYDLRVGSSPTPASGFFNGSLCAHFAGQMQSCQNVIFTCPLPTFGRYVSIQVTTTASDAENWLNVAEMTVYGVPF